MKEDFLHYVWKFRKFQQPEFRCVHGESLEIRHPGTHNLLSGPDFFNAQLLIDSQLWAGNVEIHLKSSDWYAHRHEIDSAYDNVVLHVVWEHDMEIYRRDNSPIPTLAIQKYVHPELINRYNKLFSKQRKWINCEHELAEVDDFVVSNWLERLFFERLERKEGELLKELESLQNHWEALLFRMLCKSFGLKINGTAFLNMAQSFDFSIVRKISEQEHLEALFFGQSGLLNDHKESVYYQKLQEEYAFLRHKYALQNENVIPPQFFKLRPPNFPTIRLSQLAVVYAKDKNLFSKVISAKTAPDIYKLFDVAASDYWNTHFNFGIDGPNRKKKLTKDFINLIIINTVIPLKFAHARQMGKDASEKLIKLAHSIPSEQNTIIERFNSIKPMAFNAIHSQALLQLKSEYCDRNKCLNCAIGNHLVGKQGAGE